MKEIHRKLSERFSWYANWHQNPEHHIIHYGILAIFFAAASLWAVTKTTPVESSVQNNTNIYAPFKDLNFKDRMKGKSELAGEEAIAALGLNIDRVANRYKMTGNQLKTAFKQSKTLRISKDALLFYADDLLNASVGDGIIPNNPTVADIPDEYTFFLHSRPTATAKVYLNFKGATITTPYWNSGNTLVLAPYTIDTDPAFSVTEQDNIQAIWRSVSEDYAPFNVDVTTEKPVSYDVNKYAQIIITPTSDWYGRAGGVAYLDSFTWGLDVPAFVFSQLLSNNSKYIAEAASHETGHTLGLYHSTAYDSACNFVGEYSSGSGSNPGWAPIMGNSYGKGVSQWVNDGEYPLVASIYGCTQATDQMNVVSRVVPYITDDAGDTKTSASVLVKTVSNGQANVDHYGISAKGDTDLYKIDATSGTINLTVSPIIPLSTNFMGNNDFRVRLLDSSLNVLAESNPATIANANVQYTGATNSVYYLEISPSGYLDVSQPGGYTATASMGQYNVTGSYPVNTTTADVTSPTVDIVAPISGSVVSGIVPIESSASDNVGVIRVEFYRGSVFLGEDTTAPYSFSWNTTTMLNEQVTLNAKAYDAAGNIGSSNNVTVTVNNTTADTIAPVASIISPVYGAVISPKTTGVSIKGSATDNSGVIARNEILINGNIVSSNTNSSTISYKWNTRRLAVGTYTIVLRSYDAAGNMGQASVVVTR